MSQNTGSNIVEMQRIGTHIVGGTSALSDTFDVAYNVPKEFKLNGVCRDCSQKVKGEKKGQPIDINRSAVRSATSYLCEGGSILQTGEEEKPNRFCATVEVGTDVNCVQGNGCPLLISALLLDAGRRTVIDGFVTNPEELNK